MIILSFPIMIKKMMTLKLAMIVMVMKIMMTIMINIRIKMILEEVQGGWVLALYSARLLYKLCTAPSIPGSAGLKTCNPTEKKKQFTASVDQQW